ncbi:hypothetical protein WICMUC_005785 [Wickerhamomyces mucosus]|uniref:Uncharacterized protein n=1 Tax=Wickerhamomyces mucosus TaxID=1378264 RepID=A0A9P8T3V5_9ASCO|nr:hypothetical protein WICMUC_005785 [Wickerhamomyces mucosus]
MSYYIYKELVQPIKHQIKRHKFFSTVLAILFVYFILDSRVLFNSRKNFQYLYDLNDGRGTKGFGITKGGTGNLGYSKDHRVGGLPKIASLDDKSNYGDFEIDLFDQEQYESFNKDTNKIVIILGANLEGGVNKWKGPNEWSIERSSIVNKKYYANLHGYDLVIKDYTKAKKYSDEYREGWQKLDIIKEVFDEYSNGDWFWYIDLYTLIMEPQITLEELILNHINETIQRDISYFNPKDLDIEVPFTDYKEPINLILSQDCGGFNLQSFFIKKTKWSIALLDLLFDPVLYFKTHSAWKNGEKNALEYYYNKFGWVRSRIGFVPTRLISSLPKGACPDFEFDAALFYNETSRDFLVNMMGCEYNRNCWDEMEFFKKLSDNLHKSFLTKIGEYFNFI